jgi:hypothetical protein
MHIRGDVDFGEKTASKKDGYFPVAIASLFGHIGAACGEAPRERV